MILRKGWMLPLLLASLLMVSCTSPDVGTTTETIKTLMDQGNFQQASVEVEKALQHHPDNAYLWFLKGSIARQNKDFQTTGDCFIKALELDPSLIKARFNLALTRSTPANPHYDIIKAVEDMKAVVAADPNFPNAQLHLGTFLRRRTLYEEAIEPLQNALTQTPDSPAPYLELGRSYFGLGKVPEALDALQKGRTRFSSDPEWTTQERNSCMQFIQVHMAKSDYEPVEPLLASLRELYPDDKEIQFLQGFLFIEKADVDAAYDTLAPLMDDPNTADPARIQLARLFALEDTKLGVADEYLKTVFEKTRASTWELQAVWMIVHIKQGQLDAAANNFRMASGALEYVPEAPSEDTPPAESLPEDFQYAVALLKWKQGHPDEAKQWIGYIKADPRTLLYRHVKELREKLGIEEPPAE